MDKDGHWHGYIKIVRGDQVTAVFIEPINDESARPISGEEARKLIKDEIAKIVVREDGSGPRPISTCRAWAKPKRKPAGLLHLECDDKNQEFFEEFMYRIGAEPLSSAKRPAATADFIQAYRLPAKFRGRFCFENLIDWLKAGEFPPDGNLLQSPPSPDDWNDWRDGAGDWTLRFSAADAFS